MFVPSEDYRSRYIGTQINLSSNTPMLTNSPIIFTSSENMFSIPLIKSMINIVVYASPMECTHVLQEHCFSPLPHKKKEFKGKIMSTGNKLLFIAVYCF